MSDRHEKWVEAPNGTPVPAGQPYRCEYGENARRCTASEFLGEEEPWTVSAPNEETTRTYLDSSWRPPLELPTEPTWGIAIHPKFGMRVGCWNLDEGEDFWQRGGEPDDFKWRGHNVLDFIPLTVEQVARIETAR